MNNITEPLVLFGGSHTVGSGKGCAMNVISWENGDTIITDYPNCSNPMLSRIVQMVNDDLADPYTNRLSPENSIIALDLGHATVGTAYHGLDELALRRIYVRCAVLAARKVANLDISGMAIIAINAAELWADYPTTTNATQADLVAQAAYVACLDLTTLMSYPTVSAGQAAIVASEKNFRGCWTAAAGSVYAAGEAKLDHRDEFKVSLAWEIIALFKELTGTTSDCKLPVPVDEAVASMLVSSNII